MNSPASPVIEIREMTMSFGGITAVHQLNVSVPRGLIAGLIGPNGAGKTTVFNVLTGFYTPQEGSVRFEGRDITGLKPHRICALGMARTFQNIRLFHNESALENIMIGRHVRNRSRWWQAGRGLPGAAAEERNTRKRAAELLERVGLSHYAGEKASSLPYGAQRRLEIARALATDPSFLLLDEPAAGMNPQETQELMRFIRQIRDEYNLTVLLIEHDMKVVMGVCEHIWVLEYGMLIAEGDAAAVRADPKVIEAYLGEDVSHA
jgi:branched-chain amino acid transport system ATP-binding protein